MVGDYIKINQWLMPLSWLYGAVVWLRNKLFDIGLLRQQEYDIPVIAVGNITIGGTGKTPHVEYLIRLLHDKVKVAVLSRGYKRKTQGYVIACADTTATDIGDEPFQMKTKFPDIHIAVEANRRKGIERLTHDEATSDTGAILLDDAFQHRYVKPGMNILLVDYHRLIIYDQLLPAGRLRERKSGKDRADIVIITKCPCDLNANQAKAVAKALELKEHQQIFFSYIAYDEKMLARLRDNNVLLLTGIAQPQQLENDIRPHCLKVSHIAFPDHHNFTADDARRINEAFGMMPEPKLILTTEKDFVRLDMLQGLSDSVRENINVIPIVVRIMFEQETMFNDKIISYVRKDSTDSNMA